METCRLLVFLAAAAAAHAVSFDYLIYVGTYTDKGSKGIYAYRFDPVTGESEAIGSVAETANPSFLAADPNRKYLYAVNEIDNFNGGHTGAVSAFAIDHATGRLTFLQQVSSLGADPAHLSMDKTGRYLLVANYSSGNIAVFPLRERRAARLLYSASGQHAARAKQGKASRTERPRNTDQQMKSACSDRRSRTR